MIMALINREVDTNYPLLAEKFPLYRQYYKESGLTDYAIELNDMTDLMSMDALCRATEPDFRGLFVSGSTISIIRKGDSIYDYVGGNAD